MGILQEIDKVVNCAFVDRPSDQCWAGAPPVRYSYLSIRSCDILWPMFNSIRDKVRDWVIRYADGKHTSRLLFGISFAEASFFPIPTEVFLIPIVVRHPKRWLALTLNAILASVLGAIFGYFIGFVFFDIVGETIIRFYHLEEAMTVVGERFAANVFWTIFVAGFTPIPYKVFTIAGGFFAVALAPFILASILSRGVRYIVVGYLARTLGATVSDIAYRYFNALTILVAVGFILYIILQ